MVALIGSPVHGIPSMTMSPFNPNGYHAIWYPSEEVGWPDVGLVGNQFFSRIHLFAVGSELMGSQKSMPPVLSRRGSPTCL